MRGEIEVGKPPVVLERNTPFGPLTPLARACNGALSTPELVKKTVDSLAQLTTGSNVNAANKNYFLLPNKIIKVTTTTNAKIYGPYTTIPSGFDATTVPELYKFYTNKEIREIMDKLTGMVK